MFSNKHCGMSASSCIDFVIYLSFINSQLNNRLAVSSSVVSSCRSSLSSNSIKLDTFNSLLSSNSNLVINNPSSLSSPVSSASSSLSSLKQKEENVMNVCHDVKSKESELEEERGHLNRLVEVRSFNKNNVNSISSSMILSPNIKRTICKNTAATGSNLRFKECSSNYDGNC